MASSKGPKAPDSVKVSKVSKSSKPAHPEKSFKAVRSPGPRTAARVSEAAEPPEEEDDRLADADPDKAEARSVWHAIRKHDDNKENLVLAIINPEQVGPLMERVEKRGGKLTTCILVRLAPWPVTPFGTEALHPRVSPESKLVVTTPDELQRKIDTYVTSNWRKLYLLASTTVGSITYHISGVVKDVFVYPCGQSLTSRPDTLSIGGDSTYCDVRAYQWDQLPISALPNGRQIAHGKGCSFTIQNNIEEVKAFLRRMPPMVSTMNSEKLAEVKEDLRLLHDDLASGPPGPNAPNPRPVSAGAAGPATSSTDGPEIESWFQSWKLLLAGIVGAGTGAAVAGGFMWCSAGGIFVKGPLAISLAAGYFSFAAGGGVCLAAAGAGITAGAVFYFVPWGKVFEYVRLQLWQIWDHICDIFTRIWEKIKSLASTVMSKIFLPAAPHGPKPAQFSV